MGRSMETESEVNEEEVEYDEIEEQQEEELSERQVTRRLEKAKAKAVREAEQYKAEAQALRQQLAIRDAGLTSLNERQRKALEKVHEGEWTAESLKATATDLGFVNVEETSKEELDANDRIERASAGSETAAKEDYAALISQANSVEEVMALAQRAGHPTSWDNQ